MMIAMIGAGHAGLVSGACLADFGPAPVCVDQHGGPIAAFRQAGVGETA